jgi:hypothetical protein
MQFCAVSFLLWGVLCAAWARPSGRCAMSATAAMAWFLSPRILAGLCPALRTSAQALCRFAAKRSSAMVPRKRLGTSLDW